MRLLAIDAGNTRTKWGVREEGRWVLQDALPTAEVERLAGMLRQERACDRIIVANVAGQDVERVIGAALGAAGAPVQWVRARAEQCGVRSSYAEPAKLGADRWAALIGARHLCEGPCVVVNAGTTMTVDALSSESIFLGGFIVAGYEMMRNALAMHTAQLEQREGNFSFFPDNTGDAIASGALNALAGAVDRMCRYLVASGEDEPVVLLSGGNAALLQPQFGRDPRVVPNLVLEGLVRIGAADE